MIGSNTVDQMNGHGIFGHQNDYLQNGAVPRLVEEGRMYHKEGPTFSSAHFQEHIYPS